MGGPVESEQQSTDMRSVIGHDRRLSTGPSTQIKVTLRTIQHTHTHTHTDTHNTHTHKESVLNQAVSQMVWKWAGNVESSGL